MPWSRKAPPPQVETPAGLREMAERARGLAHAIPVDVSSERLLEFANELEARASALKAAEAKPPTD